MSPEEQAAFIEKARRDIESVSGEAELSAWHDAHCNCPEYCQLDDDGYDTIEDMYSAALRALWGIGAG